MELGLNKSMEFELSQKIIEKKDKIRRITIILLIFHTIFVVLQKVIECDYSEYYKIKVTKDILLVCENLILNILVIIFLCRINNNLLILCSILYFIIGLTMVFYLVINIICDIPPPDKINELLGFILYITNILLFFVEGVFLLYCSEIIVKEKKQKKREQYGYKEDEDNINKNQIDSISKLEQ